jgi:hypothetical protein
MYEALHGLLGLHVRLSVHLFLGGSKYVSSLD